MAPHPMPDDQHFFLLKKELLPGRLVLATGWAGGIEAKRAR